MNACLNIFILLLFTPALLALADISISLHARRRSYNHDNLRNMPHCEYGLLLGTAKYVGGKNINLYYRYRIEAAAALWHAGKISTLVASGSGLNEKPSETACMQADLVAAGVPESAIWQDEAGLRTLDSIIRLRNTCGRNTRVCIVSQPFHNQRALVQARSYGLDAVACQAKIIGAKAGWKIHLRERFARLRLWYDLILRTDAQYGTDQIPIRQKPTEHGL